jgi:hypothetical protein
MIQQSVMRDWSSLVPDLIRHVGDLLLATSDVDGYIDMRAVCRGWRSAVADPRSHGSSDLRFCPRKWVMLEDDDKDDEGCLFVNVSTGRFFCRRLPLLRKGHVLVGASDGLLVLADSRHLHAYLALNPLTGRTLRFTGPTPRGHDSGTVAVAVTAGSDPMLVYASRREAWFADQASQTFSSCPARYISFIAATAAYAGHIYMAFTDGSVCRTGHREPVIATSKPGVLSTAVFLVESAGDLLLVIRHRYNFRVFRIDVERKVLEPVTSIGGRALFLGRRCLSVAADKFPTVHADCLYYATPLYHPNSLCSQDQAMYEFSIRGGEETLVSSDIR